MIFVALIYLKMVIVIAKTREGHFFIPRNIIRNGVNFLSELGKKEFSENRGVIAAAMRIEGRSCLTKGRQRCIDLIALWERNVA